MNKKLKATDKIVVKVLNGLNKGQIINFEKVDSENNMYISKEGTGFFGLKVMMYPFLLSEYIESGVYELIEGEWEEENTQEDNQNQDTYRVKKENIVQDEPIKLNKKESAIKDNIEKHKNTVTGLEIIRDLRDNQENSKYWNCKLKNVSKKYSEYDKIVKDGTVYVYLLKKENLSTKGFSMLIDEEFEPEFEKEWKEIDVQQLFDIIANFETNKYNFKRIDKDGYEGKGIDLLEKTGIVDIPKYKWYIQEK